MTPREEAAKSLASTLRKNQRAYETMSAKNARPWQLKAAADAIACHRTLLTLVEGGQPDRAEVEAALAAIPTYVSRIEKVLPKFAPGTSQHTLAVRRLEAYALAEKICHSEEQSGEE